MREADRGQLVNYQIQRIDKEEASTAVRRMKSGKFQIKIGPLFEVQL